MTTGDGRPLASGLVSALAAIVIGADVLASAAAVMVSGGAAAGGGDGGDLVQPTAMRAAASVVRRINLACRIMSSLGARINQPCAGRPWALSRLSCSSYAFANSSPNSSRKLTSGSLTISRIFSWYRSQYRSLAGTDSNAPFFS